MRVNLTINGQRRADEVEPRMLLQQVVDAAYGYKTPILGVEPGLDATSFYEPSACTFPFGTHIAVVEVDPQTGQTKFLKYVAVDDCGKILSPLLVEGQIHGGIAQGIAQAMYEEVVYDENGQLVTASFMDYAMPKPRLHAPRARAGSLARERLTKKFLYRLTSS